MVKKVLFNFLIFSLGVFLGLSIASRRTPGKISLSEESSNKVIVNTVQMVTGTVVNVSGKTMEIENEGDRLTLNASDEVFINNTEPEKKPVSEDPLKAVVGQHSPPSIKSSPDFSSIAVGRKIIAQMRKGKDGSFVVYTVDYQD